MATPRNNPDFPTIFPFKLNMHISPFESKPLTYKFDFAWLGSLTHLDSTVIPFFCGRLYFAFILYIILRALLTNALFFHGTFTLCFIIRPF